MPRQQIPLEIAQATGAKDKNPGRYVARENAPQPTGELGEPPNYFDDVHRDLWREVADMAAPGVLTKADRIVVEIAARLLRRFRAQPFESDLHPPLTGVELGHLRACLGSMGLTPADRGRVTGSNAPQTQDPLDIILGAAGAGKAN